MEDCRDCRVKVKSKQRVSEQVARYSALLRELLEAQPRLCEADKAALLQELLTNFQVTVQENVLVNGLSWDEAPEESREEVECSTLDDMLDEMIVQTSWRRCSYPKKILPYVVRSLKSERKLMNLFANAVNAQEVKRDSDQDVLMSKVSASAPAMFSQASTVMKSLKTLKQMAEGLNQVLNMKPSAETLDVYRDVFSGAHQKNSDAPCRTSTAYSADYMPVQHSPAHHH